MAIPTIMRALDGHANGASFAAQILGICLLRVQIYQLRMGFVAL
jgi:hypothetical protein